MVQLIFLCVICALGANAISPSEGIIYNKGQFNKNVETRSNFPVGPVHKGHKKELVLLASQEFIELLKSENGLKELLSSVPFFESIFNDEIYDEFYQVLQESKYRKKLRVLFVRKTDNYPCYFIGVYIEGTGMTWDIVVSYEDNTMHIKSISKAII